MTIIGFMVGIIFVVYGTIGLVRLLMIRGVLPALLIVLFWITR